MLARRVTRVYDAHLAQLPIKTNQYALLVNIAREARTLSQLADHMGLERTTLTRNLKPLVDNGWVELSVGSDPRSRMAAITAPGRRLTQRVAARWREAQAEIQATLGRGFVEDLHASIDTALARLDDGSGENPRP